MNLSEQNLNPKFSGSQRLFENAILEKLTHTHIGVPVGIFFAFSVSLLTFTIAFTELHGWLITALFFTGLLAFTLVEYLMHRFIYHLKPGGNKLSQLQYMIHGIHHDNPKDKSRLAMPPIVSVFIALLLLVTGYFFSGNFSFSFLSGFILGYAGYLLVHYITHAYPPPANLFKILWINHSIHHYKDPEKAFGVSSPLWDYVFGTVPKRKSSKKIAIRN